jgi:hypothetical protein
MGKEGDINKGYEEERTTDAEVDAALDKLVEEIKSEGERRLRDEMSRMGKTPEEIEEAIDVLRGRRDWSGDKKE